MIALWGFLVKMPKTISLAKGLSLAETDKVAGDAAAEEEGKCMEAEVSEVDE